MPESAKRPPLVWGEIQTVKAILMVLGPDVAGSNEIAAARAGAEMHKREGSKTAQENSSKLPQDRDHYCPFSSKLPNRTAFVQKNKDLDSVMWLLSHSLALTASSVLKYPG